ncbi:MAG: hypothetical protein EAZ95_06835 [Bacteroidetes bacterium]|nr:MAG: hypothetical protein EAZ95_06835 [Bacteroidota bacterium]
MENGYLLNVNDLKNLTISQVIVKLKKLSGIRLQNCTLADLVFFEGNPIYSGNGVYIFKENEDIIYVGNCVSRSFVERIPSHFDIRSGGWFNSLLLNIISQEGKEKKTDELLAKAAKKALESYSLILINYEDYSKESIDKLETVLRIVLKPYNTFKSKQLNVNYDIDILKNHI